MIGYLLSAGLMYHHPMRPRPHANDREARRAAALRANLVRRKAAAHRPGEPIEDGGAVCEPIDRSGTNSIATDLGVDGS